MTPLERDGFVVLADAIPADWIKPLRAAFEDGARPSERWPVPRGADWRHSQLDLDPIVQQVCRLPPLIEAVRAILQQPFFLSQVEGREPKSGGGAQLLHRDGDGTGTYAAAILFLDVYDAANGATRVVAGSHRDAVLDESYAATLSGQPGDIVVFDPNVLHGATMNTSGLPRRSLLISYAAETARDLLEASAELRGVRMAPSEVL